MSKQKYDGNLGFNDTNFTNEYLVYKTGERSILAGSFKFIFKYQQWHYLVRINIMQLLCT